MHGIISAVISITIPILLWLVVMRNWKPQTKLIYALKFAFWPIVILTFSLGGPISREIFGIESRYLMDLGRSIQGLIGLFIITSPIFFAIGYWRGKKMFPDSNADNGQR